MLDVIKQYLVSLGFKVDAPSYNHTMQTMQNTQNAVEKFAKTSVAQFAAAGAAVTAFVVAANAGIAKFITGLAQADLEADKLARRMWTSKENAMAYNNILKSMGVTLEDLYLSPELQRNFFELRGQINQMTAPTEFASQMKYVRSIVFEFQRLKLEATYALQWVGYYFVKYMSGPLGDIKKYMQDINKAIVREMPHWTKNVAQVMSWFARLGIAMVRGAKDIIDVFRKAGEAIPGNIKLIGAAIGALGLALQTGPIGAFIIAFSALLLLLDDYYTYMDGGKSLFEGFWKWLEKFKSELADNKDFQRSLNDLKKGMQGLSEWINKLWSDIGDSGILGQLGKDMLDIALNAKDLAVQLGVVIDELSKLAGFEGFGDMLNKNIISSLKQVDQLLQTISGELKALTKLFKGDFSGFWEEDQKATGKLRKAVFGESINGFFGDIFGKDGMFGSSSNPVENDFYKKKLTASYATPAPSTATPTPTPMPTQFDFKIDSKPQIQITIDKEGNVLGTRVSQEEAMRIVRNLQGVQR